jgi:hypothetical protein
LTAADQTDHAAQIRVECVIYDNVVWLRVKEGREIVIEVPLRPDQTLDLATQLLAHHRGAARNDRPAA